MAGKKVKAWFSFGSGQGESIQVKFALSAVSSEGALKNLLAETPHWDFEQIRKQAEAQWETELGKMRVEGTEMQKENFYTALYHSFLSPTVYMDVDGAYRGLDHNIHRAEGFVNYTTFSLWDTYRALHPLFTIIQQQRTNDIVQSMLAHYDQSVHHMLPVWSHYANENWCMIGYHAVSVIADAYLKGIRGYDVNKALEACNRTATNGGYDGLQYYLKYGYVPADLNTDAASKTLEYAYDDWTIMKMAGQLGNKELAEKYRQRSRSFEHIFDSSTHFMRAKKSDGSWQTPFDPLSTEGQGFIEGNAWNYSLYVPHDVPKLISYYGGNTAFIAHLDSLFEQQLDQKYFQHSEDINAVGIIGNYVHGNEPSHHVPYLYNYAGAPWKTQQKIHEIMDKMYHNTPGGLCGNDDCGQMSAWYIFSAMGFYPVCPGSNEYAIGSPCLSQVTISLENGKTFVIKSPGLSEKNRYLQKISLNGKPYDKLVLRHEDIINGGELVFTMGAKPNYKLK